MDTDKKAFAESVLIRVHPWLNGKNKPPATPENVRRCGRRWAES